MKKLFLILLTSFCFGQQIYFKDKTGVYTQEAYTKLKEEKLAKFDKMYLSTICEYNLEGDQFIETLKIVKQDKDSIIKEFKLLSLPKKFVDLINVKPKNIGMKFPIKKLKDVNGNSISFEDLNGKPTLIHFWFSKCLPCIYEIPNLNELATKYEGKINFIGITFDSKSTVKKFLAENKFNFLQIINERKTINKLKIESYPENIFLDKEGIITTVYNPYSKFIKYENPDDFNLTIEFSEILDKLLE